MLRYPTLHYPTGRFLINDATKLMRDLSLSQDILYSSSCSRNGEGIIQTSALTLQYQDVRSRTLQMKEQYEEQLTTAQQVRNGGANVRSCVRNLSLCACLLAFVLVHVGWVVG